MRFGIYLQHLLAVLHWILQQIKLTYTCIDSKITYKVWSIKDRTVVIKNFMLIDKTYSSLLPSK